MKALLTLLLAMSLTANAWLFLRPFGGGHASEVANLRSAQSAHLSTGKGPDFPVADAKLLAALDTTDLVLLRDQLRAAGVDDPSIRGVIEGALRQRYREQVSAWRVERLRTAWWRGGRSAPGESAPSQRKLVDDQLRTLLGPDPLDLADAEVRYDFLSPEKRRLLAMIDLDYAELQARVPAARTNAALKSDLDQQQLLTKERQKDLIAALTPDERAEYDLRFSSSAVLNSRRFATIEVTEPEFRIIEPIVDALQQQESGLPNDAKLLATRAGIEQRTMDKLVAVLGYDRAIDYVWGVDSGPYVDTVSLLHEANLPTTNASHLLQLAAETGIQAAAIHADMSSTPEQKRTALAALQQSVRPQLDALVPPAIQAKLPESAISWFTIMSDGQYQMYRPVMYGSGWMVPSSFSVMTPPKEPRSAVPLPRAPGK